MFVWRSTRFDSNHIGKISVTRHTGGMHRTTFPRLSVNKSYKQRQKVKKIVSLRQKGEEDCKFKTKSEENCKFKTKR